MHGTLFKKNHLFPAKNIRNALTCSLLCSSSNFTSKKQHNHFELFLIFNFEFSFQFLCPIKSKFTNWMPTCCMFGTQHTSLAQCDDLYSSLSLLSALGTEFDYRRPPENRHHAIGFRFSQSYDANFHLKTNKWSFCFCFVITILARTVNKKRQTDIIPNRQRTIDQAHAIKFVFYDGIECRFVSKPKFWETQNPTCTCLLRL